MISGCAEGCCSVLSLKAAGSAAVLAERCWCTVCHAGLSGGMQNFPILLCLGQVTAGPFTGKVQAMLSLEEVFGCSCIWQ